MDALKSEILNDPAQIGYAGKTPSEVLSLLTAKTRPKIKAISSAELLAWSGANQRRRKLREGKEHANADIANLCEVAIVLLERDGTVLDLWLPDRLAMVNALTAGGVLTAEDVDALYAIATVSVSRLEEIGLPEVHLGDVQFAINGHPA